MEVINGRNFLLLLLFLVSAFCGEQAFAAKDNIITVDDVFEEVYVSKYFSELEAAEGGMSALFKGGFQQNLIHNNEWDYDYYGKLKFTIYGINNYSRLRSTDTIELTAGNIYLGFKLDGSEGNKITSLIKDDVVLELVRADNGITYDDEVTMDGGKHEDEPNPETGVVFQYFYTENYDIDPQYIPDSGVTISLIDDNKCIVAHATGYDVSNYKCAEASVAVNSNNAGGVIYGVVDTKSYDNVYTVSNTIKNLVDNASSSSQKKAVVEQFMPNRNNLAYQNNISSFSNTTGIIKGNRVNVFALNDNDPYKYLVASNDLFGLITKSQTYGINEGIWGKVFYQDATQDADRITGTPKVDIDSTGLIVGRDKAFMDDRFLLGGSLGYIYSDASDDFRNTDVDTYFANIYGSYMFTDNLFLTNILEYSFNDYYNKRFMSALGEMAKADYESNNYNVLNELGYNIKLYDDKMILTPRASLNFHYIDQENYTERGSSMNQTVVNDNIYQYETGMGLDFSHLNKLMSLDSVVVCKLSFDYKREMRDLKTNQNVSFVDGGSSFVVYGSDQDKDRFNAGLAIDYVKEEFYSVGLEYNREFKNEYHADRYALNGKYKF